MKLYNGKVGGKGQTILGKMCAYNLNGVNVMRSVPESVKVTITEELLNRRARFSALSKLVKSLNGVFIMHTFPQMPGQNYRNPAMTANKNAVTVSGSQDVVVDYAVLVLSKGSLAIQNATATQASAGANITVTWTPNTAVGASPTDTVYVLVYNETQEVVSLLEDDARSSGGISIPTTGIDVGDRVFVYTFVKSSNGAFWSDSFSAGGIVIA